MALITLTNTEAKENKNSKLHNEVKASYSKFMNGNSEFLHIETYGSPERENPGRASQTIQFSRQFIDQIFPSNQIQENTSDSIKTNFNNTTFIDTPPFLILAGISGTGKSRFVREQAKKTCGLPYKQAPSNPDNLCLTPVRPDWHEPSDLLGYVSRINGTQYIPTDFLKFLVSAWYEVFSKSGSLNSINPQSDDSKAVRPFWLCLDEMNLAPVEQYFADYLSILETRRWDNNGYSCDSIISNSIFEELKKANYKEANGGLEGTPINSFEKLKSDLVPENVNNEIYDKLWSEFESQKFGGIPIPPNLIVAGTVNMDETTHGFSRKVLDRAMSLDFNAFYPNDYDSFFKPKVQPKTLTYSTTTQVTKTDLDDTVDENGTKTIEFLKSINEILKNTPFELAFRALNQALLMIKMWGQGEEDDILLAAIWDDFLMTKVLPRIEGDEQKIGEEDKSVLKQLELALQENKIFNEIWEGEKRPDLLQESVELDGDNKPLPAPHIECRSRIKLNWMIERMERGYTSFWA